MLIMIERTRIRELLFVLLSLCHVVVQLEPARAATISKGDGKFCDFHLRGRIEPKDIEEFRHLVVTGDGSDALRVWWLCLNSEEGGNFQTALQMIDHMLEQGGYFKGIGTRVEPNSRCFSACALIFLAGKRLLGDSDSEIVREMHPTSTLGFHQPNYRQDVAASDSSQLFYAYEAGVTAIAKLLSYDANMFPKSLLVEFLKKRAGESFEISKIDDLGRWNINLYDYSAPVITLREQLYTFCANADGWRTGEPSSFPMEYVRNDPNMGKEVKTLVQRKLTFKVRERYTFPNFGSTYEQLCNVKATYGALLETDKPSPDKLSLSASFGFSPTSREAGGTSAGIWGVLPPDTPIASLRRRPN